MKPTVGWNYGEPLKRIVQKPIPGPGKFVVRWRGEDGCIQPGYLTHGMCWTQLQKCARIFRTWKDAEWFCDSVEGWDKELPGPAIVKLVPKKTVDMGSLVDAMLSAIVSAHGQMGAW